MRRSARWRTETRWGRRRCCSPPPSRAGTTWTGRPRATSPPSSTSAASRSPACSSRLAPAAWCASSSTHGGDFDLDLSLRLQAAHGLRHCIVVDGPDGDDELLRGALGRAAARLLTEIVGADDVLGLAWARSLLAMRSSLEQLAAVHRRAAHGGAAPAGRRRERDRARARPRRPVRRAELLLLRADDRPRRGDGRVMRTQPEIARALDVARRVTKAVVGVGAWRRPVDGGRRGDRGRVARGPRAGRRAEIGGVAARRRGRPVATSLTDASSASTPSACAPSTT